MKTVTVLIGNSDDKLRQSAWSEFVQIAGAIINVCSSVVYFSGASNSTAVWQNAAWVFAIEENKLDILKRDLKELRQTYLQDSVAVVVGQTEMV